MPRTTKSQATLLIREAEHHARVHADYGLVQQTSGGNMEIHFCRDLEGFPEQPIPCELTEDGVVRPVVGSNAHTLMIREILCSVRMRPDHALDLAEHLLRTLQQQAAQSMEGAGDGDE